MRIYSVLPLIFLLNGSPAMAGELNVLGFDDMSCSAWSKSKDDPDLRKNYVAWVRGVLTGDNYASGTVELNVNRYCSKNPNGLFSDAALRMSDEFSGRNQPIRK